MVTVAWSTRLNPSIAESLFDSAVSLFHAIVQVLARSHLDWARKFAGHTVNLASCALSLGTT
jgi:hypothetical protein